MVRLESDKTKEELISSWDDKTSPSRFAGSDETMDLIFTSKRKGDRVTLVRRAASVRDPYSCVFRGRIRSKDGKSEIVGWFGKALIDYIATALIIALLFYVRYVIISRGDSGYTIGILLTAALLGGLFLLYNTRAAKRRYVDFMFEITEKPLPMFLSRKEIKEAEEREGSQK